MCVATSNLPEHRQPELRYGVEKRVASPYIQLFVEWLPRGARYVDPLGCFQE